MDAKAFKQRTQEFALRVIRLVEALPKSLAAQVLGKQLLRSATSVGANYRAACRAKSPADFTAKMSIVEEECDESVYWMDMIVKAGLMGESKVAALRDEGEQILAMVVASIKTARRSRRLDKSTQNRASRY